MENSENEKPMFVLVEDGSLKCLMGMLRTSKNGSETLLDFIHDVLDVTNENNSVEVDDELKEIFSEIIFSASTVIAFTSVGRLLDPTVDELLNVIDTGADINYIGYIVH